MLRTLAAFAAIASASAFAPASSGLPRLASSRPAACSLRMQSSPPATKIEQEVKLTKELFNKLDADGSGSIDMAELKAALGNNLSAEIQALMARGDIDGNGVIDYAEYERLMNMQRFDDAQGGNLYVRNAIKFGLLKPDSVLADCVMVGNKGFDPFNCATSMDSLKNYREAELKHGRLAMLAAAGWPVSELVQPFLSKFLGQPDLLAAGEKAPSLLNGGLDRVNPVFFMAIIVFTATIESVAFTRTRDADYIPGDLGFDPLRLYTGKSEPVKRDLELKELNNGRLAMLAITAYAYEEFLTKASVIQDTPFLFKSIL
eukprot:766814-Hanusia_phi.AAC.2